MSSVTYCDFNLFCNILYHIQLLPKIWSEKEQKKKGKISKRILINDDAKDVATIIAISDKKIKNKELNFDHITK